MARLKSSSNEPINLFPMIDILTGTIGCFIFFITAISVFSLGPGRSIAIHAQSAMTGKHAKQPVFIEWDGRSIVIHPEKTRVPLSLTTLTTEERARSSSSSVSASGDTLMTRNINRQIDHTPFADLLQRVSRSRSATYLVVMVRPSGFDTFLTLRNYLLNKGVDVGYDPISQEWNLEVKRDVPQKKKNQPL